MLMMMRGLWGCLSRRCAADIRVSGTGHPLVLSPSACLCAQRVGSLYPLLISSSRSPPPRPSCVHLPPPSRTRVSLCTLLHCTAGERSTKRERSILVGAVTLDGSVPSAGGGGGSGAGGAHAGGGGGGGGAAAAIGGLVLGPRVPMPVVPPLPNPLPLPKGTCACVTSTRVGRSLCALPVGVACVLYVNVRGAPCVLYLYTCGALRAAC
jgi:hypothetical protein